MICSQLCAGGRNVWQVFFVLVFLLAGFGCATKSTHEHSLHHPTIKENSPISKRLASGPYYVSLSPDGNKLRYYPLTRSIHNSIAEASLQMGECQPNAERRISADKMRRIDVFVRCPRGSGIFQFPSGRVGALRATRVIVSPFPPDALLVGDIGPHGEIALGYDATTSGSSANVVLLYPRNADHPGRVIRLYTRICTDRNGAAGPSHYPGSPREISFDFRGNLIIEVGPESGEPCAYEYVERFQSAAEPASWFAPGLPSGNRDGQPSIFAVPGSFVIDQQNEVAFGAYVGGPPPRGKIGSAYYSSSLSGYQIPPLRTFGGAVAGFAKYLDLSIRLLGVDETGRTYLQGGPGGRSIAVFPHGAIGLTKPADILNLPRQDVGTMGTLVDVY